MILTVKIDAELADGTGCLEQSYAVEMSLEGRHWLLESVTPTPPNQYIEERVMEMAVRQLEDAIWDATVEKEEWKAETREIADAFDE